MPQLIVFGPERNELWKQEGLQHLDLVPTEQDYSTENTNYCSATFHARKILVEGETPHLSASTELLASVEYSVSLSDEGDWYVTPHDVQW